MVHDTGSWFIMRYLIQVGSLKCDRYLIQEVGLFYDVPDEGDGLKYGT